jgi:hypothetical protein
MMDFLQPWLRKWVSYLLSDQMFLKDVKQWKLIIIFLDTAKILGTKQDPAEAAQEANLE